MSRRRVTERDERRAARDRPFSASSMLARAAAILEIDAAVTVVVGAVAARARRPFTEERTICDVEAARAARRTRRLLAVVAGPAPRGRRRDRPARAQEAEAVDVAARLIDAAVMRSRRRTCSSTMRTVSCMAEHAEHVRPAGSPPSVASPAGSAR
jgi:hypothetical protein